jgi:hypothetical protein
MKNFTFGKVAGGVCAYVFQYVPRGYPLFVSAGSVWLASAGRRKFQFDVCAFAEQHLQIVFFPLSL